MFLRRGFPARFFEAGVFYVEMMSRAYPPFRLIAPSRTGQILIQSEAFWTAYIDYVL